MDFKWTEQQSLLKQEIINFAQKELTKDLRQLDKEEVFNLCDWQKCGDFGIPGFIVPKEYGGKELDILSSVYALEGFGYGCIDNGLIFAMNAHMWACIKPLLTFGDEEQKKRYLPKLANGSWICGHAASEPEAGSDICNLKTTAKKIEDNYVLNGHKIYVTNGPVCDLLIVFANIDPELKQHGLTAFLVEKNTPGLEVKSRVSKMGMRTAMMGEFTLKDCVVPVKNRLSKEGAGSMIFHHGMEWERGFILAGAVGTMQRLLEQSIKYARKRKQFGQPIGKFQMISEKLVHMKIRLENSRGHLYKVAWLKKNGKMAIMEAAMAKLYISEAWVETCLDAMQIHGGQGYLTENGLERELRDALGSRIYSGTSEIQKNIIAKFIGV